MATLPRFLLFLLLPPALALGEPPPRPFASFEAAKKAARDGIYSEHHMDFYCGCAWTPNKSGTGGKINATSCGYEARKNEARGKVLEWEHVVPASFFGEKRACWKNGHPKCVRADGKSFKGRSCCAKVDKTFRRIEADLHNPAPAVGELNADRSNTRYGIVDGELRAYGACDFEVGGGEKGHRTQRNCSWRCRQDLALYGRHLLNSAVDERASHV